MIRHMYAGPGIDAAKMRAEAHRLSTTNDRLHKATTCYVHYHAAVRGTSIREAGCPEDCVPDKFYAVVPEDPVVEETEEPRRDPMMRTCEWCGRSVPINERCSCPEGSRPVTIDPDGTVHA